MLHLTFHQEHDYLLAEVRGIVYPDCALAAFERIAAECRSTGCRYLVIDASFVTGSLSSYEHRLLGELARDDLADMERVAFVMANTNASRVSESAARARGLDARVFTARSEAIAWLPAGAAALAAVG